MIFPFDYVSAAGRPQSGSWCHSSARWAYYSTEDRGCKQYNASHHNDDSRPRCDAKRREARYHSRIEFLILAPIGVRQGLPHHGLRLFIPRTYSTAVRGSPAMGHALLRALCLAKNKRSCLLECRQVVLQSEPRSAQAYAAPAISASLHPRGSGRGTDFHNAAASARAPILAGL